MRLQSVVKSAGVGLVVWMLLAGAFALLHRPLARAALAKPNETALSVELHGRVVCLAEEMNELYRVELPTGHPHLYGFKTTDSRYFTLLRNKYSEGLFVDARLREKDLILKGRTFPKTQLFEVSAMRSVKNGVTNDLYYFCVICSIKAVGPGRCECCQDPVELVERPVDSATP